MHSFAELDLDLSTIGPGLVAIAGPTGAGKSTLMECMGPVPLYLRFPSYPGHLRDRVNARKAYVDLDWEHGTVPYRSLVQVDPEWGGGAGKVEPFLYCNGAPVNVEFQGKVREYEATIAELMMPEALFLASVFATQGGVGSFVSAELKDRREVFARLLGLDQLERLSGIAATRRKLRDARLLEIEEQRGPLVKMAPPDVDRQLKDAGDRLHVATEADKAAETAMQVAVAACNEATRTAARFGERLELMGEQDDLAKALEAKPQALADHAALADAQTSRGSAIDRYEAVRAAGRAATEQHTALAHTLGVTQVRVELLQSRLANPVDLAPLEAKVAERDRYLCDVADGEVELAKLEETRTSLAIQVATDAAEAQALGAAGQAVQFIDEVPCQARELVQPDTGEAVDCAACPLLEQARDAIAASPKAYSPTDAEERRGHVVSLAARIADVRKTIEENRRMAHALQGTPAALEGARVRLEERRLAEHDLQGALTERDRQLAAVQRAKDRVDECAQELANEKAHGQKIAAEIERLKHADEIMRVLLRQEARLEQVRARLAELSEASPTDLNKFKAEERDAIGAHTLAREAWKVAWADYHRIEGQAQAFAKVRDRVVELDARMGSLTRERAGYRLLEQAFGRTGLQVLEMDAAGPEVSRITNELLEAFGSRFSVSLRTQTDAVGGRVAKETFELQVHDPRSRTRDHREHSGGERVVVDEAFKLALALFNAARGRTPMRTLWRDECDGHLDPELALRYPATLRRAAELGGFDRVFFISHRQDVAEQADTILRVEDGQVTVERRS